MFSSWTKTFDLLQPELIKRSIRCVRLDGSVNKPAREKVLRVFRDNAGIAVLLATITCGGVGLNLTAASRAYIVEPQWNPMSELQALDRIHRLGQKREVHTTRYLIKGTWEEVRTRLFSVSDFLTSSDFTHPYFESRVVDWPSPAQDLTLLAERLETSRGA